MREYFQVMSSVSLTAVYQMVYPNTTFEHVPMRYEYFYRLKVFNETYTSVRGKGNSSAICAYWAGISSSIAPSTDKLLVGIIQYFIKHLVHLTTTSQTNVLARVHWYKTHMREGWFHQRALVVSL